MSSGQEMSLKQFVETLPRSHSARKEYKALLSQASPDEGVGKEHQRQHEEHAILRKALLEGWRLMTRGMTAADSKYVYGCIAGSDGEWKDTPEAALEALITKLRKEADRERDQS